MREAKKKTLFGTMDCWICFVRELFSGSPSAASHCLSPSLSVCLSRALRAIDRVHVVAFIGTLRQ